METAMPEQNAIEPPKGPSRRSLRGLDWLNFLLADVRTGLGPFLAIYLAAHNWDEERVGLALTVGGIAGIFTQTPTGGSLPRSVERHQAMQQVCAIKDSH
jgi:hypothetical protein